MYKKSLSGQRQIVTQLLDRVKKEIFPLGKVTERLNDYMLTLAFKTTSSRAQLKVFTKLIMLMKEAGQQLVVSQA